MSAAYLSALSFARERKQGSSITNWKDPEAPRVPIIDHPAVRNLLIDMKSRVEGVRALIVKLTTHFDYSRSLSGKDDAKVAYHQGQIELLTPLVKAYGSDQAFRVCEHAIQVHGGVGYTKDFPVEQYARDAKIFSVYEGTKASAAVRTRATSSPTCSASSTQSATTRCSVRACSSSRSLTKRSPARRCSSWPGSVRARW
jgi:alkylation response protein AidB-like acyl-CoA dehydrogenase